MTRILIAVDGSELDAVCAGTAHQLFGDDADYLAVNVSDAVGAGTPAATVPVPFGYVYPYAAAPPPMDPRLVDSGPEIGGDRVDPVAHAEDVARRAADAAGLVNAETLGEIGDPGEAIVEAAERNGCSVIVVGSHERGWLSRLVSPSVSNEVMAASNIPVLVVKAPS